MDAWLKVYSEIVELAAISNTRFFRGHSDSSWELKSCLARLNLSHIQNREKNAYFEYITRAGNLIQENNSCWSNVISMQHYGLPTRLLDWTENFSVALYFAMKQSKGECCVWMLNPFELNKKEIGKAELYNPEELHNSYEDCFLELTTTFPADVLAISPLRHQPRVFNQCSGFTVHRDLDTPLEQLHPDVLKQIIIPPEAHIGARKYLRLSGISEFTIFPDLDGLAREIRKKQFEM